MDSIAYITQLEGQVKRLQAENEKLHAELRFIAYYVPEDSVDFSYQREWRHVRERARCALAQLEKERKAKEYRRGEK